MRCMVKLQDLVDFVEPLLGVTSGASTSDHSKDEAMDLDGEDEYQDGASLAQVKRISVWCNSLSLC